MQRIADGHQEVQDVETERIEAVRVRAELRLRNDNIITARKNLGLSQKKLANAAGVPFFVVTRLEHLDYHGRIGEHANTLAEFLDLPLEIVMPPELEGKTIPSTIVVMTELDAGKLLDMQDRFKERFMLPAPGETGSALDDSERRQAIEKALAALTVRERAAVELRFGLNEEAQERISTLDAIGKRFNVTRARAGQILDKALRKLQHPAIIKSLRERLGENPDDPIHVREGKDKWGRMQGQS